LCCTSSARPRGPTMSFNDHKGGTKRDGSLHDGAEHAVWGKEDGEERKARLDEMFMVPGEVMSRRTKKVTKEEVAQEKEEYVSLDWDDIFPKKPKERLRWLFKAFEGAKKGKVKPQPLFDIIVHRKFVEGVQGNVATDTLNLIRGNLKVFSPKQAKQLTSDSFELFRKYAPIGVLDSDEDEPIELPPPPEVIIEDKGKKKKQAQEERRRREEREREEEEGERNSDDDIDTKKRRILSKGIERRVDKADNAAYTLEEFVEQYGGRLDKPPVEWENARHSAFIFKE